MITLTSWPNMAWTSDPAAPAGAGLTHAAHPSQGTALCGAQTPFHGERWPWLGEPWSAPYGRCAACAGELYASRRP